METPEQEAGKPLQSTPGQQQPMSLFSSLEAPQMFLAAVTRQAGWLCPHTRKNPGAPVLGTDNEQYKHTGQSALSELQPVQVSCGGWGAFSWREGRQKTPLLFDFHSVPLPLSKQSRFFFFFSLSLNVPLQDFYSKTELKAL